jgi:DNA polymerase V
MMAMDSINRRWGRQTLRTGAQGYGRAWEMRRERLSPSYTTRWEDILVVR